MWEEDSGDGRDDGCRASDAVNSSHDVRSSHSAAGSTRHLQRRQPRLPTQRLHRGQPVSLSLVISRHPLNDDKIVVRLTFRE